MSPLKRGPAGILQLNIGLYCNQVLKLRSSALLCLLTTRSTHAHLPWSASCTVTSMSRRPANMQHTKHLFKRPPREKCIPAIEAWPSPTQA